jgi:hypothetical protein
MAYNTNGKWGFVARDARRVEFILPATFEMAYPFRYGRAAVRKGTQWGFINDKGEVVIPYQYEDVQKGVFRNGVAVVKKGGKYGVIDIAGKEILPPKFDSIVLAEKEGRLLASIPNTADENDFFGLHGMYDLAGKQLLPHEYQDIYPRFKGGVTVVMKKEKSAIVAADGKLLTPLTYDRMLHSDISHYIGVKEKEKTTDLFDERGTRLFTAPFEYVSKLSDNRAVYKDPAAQNKYGYYDGTGKVAIPPQFFTAMSFSEDLAVTKRTVSGPVELIDTTGKTVATIPNVFTRLDEFRQGVIWLASNADKKIYLYDKKGAKVFPQGFDYAADYDENGLSRAQMPDKKYGLINKKGEWVIKPEWTAIEASSIPGQYIVTKDKDRGIVSATGEVLFAPQGIVIDGWDADFVRIRPPGFQVDGEYFCFWRKDGVYYYDQRKAE